MSAKVKFERCEWAAILVAAFLVLAFLGLAVVKNFIQAYWNNEDSANHSQQTQEIQGWLTVLVAVLTLAVLSFQAWIYHKQRLLMKEQSAISLRQVDLEERRFTVEHRPRLIMNQVWLYQTDKGIHIHFVIKNVGPSDAEIGLITFSFEVMLFGSKDPRAMQAETGSVMVLRTLDQGNVFGDCYLFNQLGLPYSQRDENSRCFFSGEVSYRSPGDRKFKYTLGFCREMHGRSPVFRISENPMREYSH